MKIIETIKEKLPKKKEVSIVHLNKKGETVIELAKAIKEDQKSHARENIFMTTDNMTCAGAYILPVAITFGGVIAPAVALVKHHNEYDPMTIVDLMGLSGLSLMAAPWAYRKGMDAAYEARVIKIEKDATKEMLLQELAAGYVEIKNRPGSEVK